MARVRRYVGLLTVLGLACARGTAPSHPEPAPPTTGDRGEVGVDAPSTSREPALELPPPPPPIPSARGPVVRMHRRVVRTAGLLPPATQLLGAAAARGTLAMFVRVENDPARPRPYVVSYRPGRNAVQAGRASDAMIQLLERSPALGTLGDRVLVLAGADAIAYDPSTEREASLPSCGDRDSIAWVQSLGGAAVVAADTSGARVADVFRPGQGCTRVALGQRDAVALSGDTLVTYELGRPPTRIDLRDGRAVDSAAQGGPPCATSYAVLDDSLLVMCRPAETSHQHGYVYSVADDRWRSIGSIDARVNFPAAFRFDDRWLFVTEPHGAQLAQYDPARDAFETFETPAGSLDAPWSGGHAHPRGIVFSTYSGAQYGLFDAEHHTRHDVVIDTPVPETIWTGRIWAGNGMFLFGAHHMIDPGGGCEDRPPMQPCDPVPARYEVIEGAYFLEL